MTLPLTILTCRDQIIRSHDEFFADILEDNCNIPCQLGTYYIHMEVVVLVQQV